MCNWVLDMPNKNPAYKRRRILKTTATGVITATVVGSGKASGRLSTTDENQNEPVNTNETDADVGTEAVTSISITFSDYDIGITDTTIMTCEWEVNNYALPCDVYNLEALIDAMGLRIPETVSTPGFSTDWELVNNKWQWMPSGQILCDGTYTMQKRLHPYLVEECLQMQH